MYFRVLGPVELNGEGGERVEIPALMQRRLLTALLLRANTWVSADYLVETLWPERSPRSTANNVRTYIHHLRTVVPRYEGLTRIESRRGGDYRLRLDRHECDATVFEDRVSDANGAPAAAVDQLTAALELWRGNPYEPLAGAEVEAEAERLRAMLWHARYSLAEALLATNRADDAITLLRPLTAEDPLRERTWEYLLRALAEDGRWAEVLVTFQRVREVLAEELGIEPGPELRHLHQLALHANEERRKPRGVPVASGREPDQADALVAPPRAGRTGIHRTRRRRWPALLASAAALAATVYVVDPLHLSTPELTFLTPNSGQVLHGTVTLRVDVSNPARVEQVDFHWLTSRCPGGGPKFYIGRDETPNADGEYEITFDTRRASNGCVDFGAVALDRDDEHILYPEGGKYVVTTIDN